MNNFIVGNVIIDNVFITASCTDGIVTGITATKYDGRRLTVKKEEIQPQPEIPAINKKIVPPFRPKTFNRSNANPCPRRELKPNTKKKIPCQ